MYKAVKVRTIPIIGIGIDMIAGCFKYAPPLLIPN